MISVDEATRLVLALAGTPRPQTLPLNDALGRVLVQPAVATLTQPPFDASAMDGYAVISSDLPGPLQVIGTSSAGHPWTGTARTGTAVRIFTGAPVPAGYDQVVVQEAVLREGDQITAPDAGAQRHIRPAGDDFSAGTPFFPRRPLRAADLALLAAMNLPEVTVVRRPTVAVLAGGDELIRPGQTPGPGQIICSNDIAIAALARQAGAEARILPIARDTEASLRDSFAQAADADLIVTIGGASVGDHDLIAKVAGEMGLKRAFYKLAMRPGRPLMAGEMGSSRMLGLPGNPVSAIVCAKLFMQPLLMAMQGLNGDIRLQSARLSAPLQPEGDRQHYLRAQLSKGDHLPLITSFAVQDSARLATLAQADALLLRPAFDPAREAGEIVQYISLDM